MTTLYERFAERFGEDQAKAIQQAGDGHRTDILDGSVYGSDPFLDAVAIAIGHECFTRDSFRRCHGITAPAADIKAFLIAEDVMSNYDGPVDYLALMAGIYNEYVGIDGGEGAQR